MPREELARQIAAMQPGDHYCAIYETEQEQMAMVVPFMSQGFARGDRVIYVADDRPQGEIARPLVAAGIDVDAERARGALRIDRKGSAYLRSGVFDPRRMIEYLRTNEHEGLAAGFCHLRFAGEMSWALGPETDRRRLIEYEALLNEYLPGSNTLCLCMYDRRRFDPAVIHDVLRTHPTAILGDMVCPNPYYEPAELVLGAELEGNDEYKARRADWWIERLKHARAQEMERESLCDRLGEYSEVLREMSRRLLAAQEEERRSIARELHDDVGQSATSIRFLIEAIAQSVPATDPAQDKLAAARDLLDHVAAHVRDLSANLRPALLDDLGLLPAVRDLVRRFSANTGVKVDLRVDETQARFDPAVETAAYRIVQEALTNVARHANVSEAAVRIWFDGAALFAQIEDQGAGFDTTASRQPGLKDGVRGIEERAALLGGRVEIDSSPGGGTHILAEIPATVIAESNIDANHNTAGR